MSAFFQSLTTRISALWSLLATSAGAGLIGYADSTLQSALNQLAGSIRAENYPFEDFDRVDGTLVKNMVTVSGHTLSASGTAELTASVINNCMYSPGNVYIGLSHSALITRVSGVYSFDELTVNRPVIMFNGGPTNTTLTGLVHAEIYTNGPLLKLTTTGPANLTVWAGTYKARHGHSGRPELVSGDVKPGVKYKFAMEYTAGATDLDDILTIYLPDGRVLDYVGDARLRVIMSTCYHGTWQLTGGSGGRWHSIALGPERASVAAANGGAAMAVNVAPTLGLNKYYNKQRVSIKPTGVGWYTIATQKAADSSTNACTGHITLHARENGGRHTSLEAYVNCHGTASPTIKFIGNGYGGYGGNSMSQIRLSTDSAINGLKQLDVYIAYYSGSSDEVNIDLDGSFTIVSAPVVGAVALAKSRVQLMGDVANMARNETNVTTKTFTPGTDYGSQILINHYAGAIDFFVDNTVAGQDDRFEFARAAGWSQNAVLKNTSDSSTIATLTPGTTVRIGVISGKFEAISKGTC